MTGRRSVARCGVVPLFAALASVQPGRALATACKIGELRIEALRAKSRAELGDKLDLRRFHNAVIDNGAVPLDVLDQQIIEWIAAERVRAR